MISITAAKLLKFCPAKMCEMNEQIKMPRKKSSHFYYINHTVHKIPKHEQNEKYICIKNHKCDNSDIQQKLI